MTGRRFNLFGLAGVPDQVRVIAALEASLADTACALFADTSGVRCRLFFLALIIPQRMRTACERISMREDRGPQLSVPIDAELKARLEAAAAREDRPLASFVRRIVMKALDGEREGSAA